MSWPRWCWVCMATWVSASATVIRQGGPGNQGISTARSISAGAMASNTFRKASWLPWVLVRSWRHSGTGLSPGNSTSWPLSTMRKAAWTSAMCCTRWSRSGSSWKPEADQRWNQTASAQSWCAWISRRVGRTRDSRWRAWRSPSWSIAQDRLTTPYSGRRWDPGSSRPGPRGRARRRAPGPERRDPHRRAAPDGRRRCHRPPAPPGTAARLRSAPSPRPAGCSPAGPASPPDRCRWPG